MRVSWGLVPAFGSIATLEHEQVDHVVGCIAVLLAITAEIFDISKDLGLITHRAQ